MIASYLKLVARFFFRKRISSSLNLASLVVGIFCFLFISLYVHNELNFDRHNLNYSSIYRVITQITSNDFSGVSANTSLNLANSIRENYPENLYTVGRFIHYGINTKITYENIDHRIEHTYFADQDVLKIFSYNFKIGNPIKALEGINKIVISESTATRIFGSGSALGKAVTIDNTNYEVTGIIDDLPPNSDLPINCLLSINPKLKGDWSDWKAYTYILLNPNTDVSDINNILLEIQKKYVNPFLRNSEGNIQTNFKIQPLSGLHFINDLYNDTPKGNKTYVYFLSITGILILVISCFNFVNLSIARSLERGIEVGIRKVLGACRREIIIQYILESVILTIIAFLISVILLMITLPSLNNFTSIDLSILSILNWEMLLLILCLLLVVGVASSIYPALFLSAFNPSKILKGKSIFKGKGSLKDILIVIQFAVSIGMVICTILIYNQLSYLKNKDAGFQRENVVIVKLPEEINYSQVTTFKSELERLGNIEGVSVVGFGSRPGSGDTEKEFFMIEQFDGLIKRTVNCIFVDESFLKVLKINLLTGDTFNKKNISTESFIVNEAFVKQMGWKNAIGKKIVWRDEGKVIGVVKDYNYQSLYNKIEPLILIGYSNVSKEILIKIKHTDDIKFINKAWNNVVGDYVFDFSFLDLNLDTQYRNDQNILNIFALFSIATLILAYIGLFALSYLDIQQRTKEIGIRKLLGSRSIDLVYLFTRKIVFSLLISFLVAAPLAWYLIVKWTDNFVYREKISYWAFVFSGVTMLLFAIAICGYNVLKIANNNPVNSLRGE